MAYANKYYLTFKNRQNDLYTVYFLQDGFVGTVEELEGGPEPCVIDYGSGDEFPWLGIRGHVAKFQYYNNGDHPLSNFAANNDNEYKYEVYKGAQLKWTGFIVQDDCAEPLTKPSRYLVNLQGTDNVGLLKDVPLSDIPFFDDYGKKSILNYFSYILQETGLQLPINFYVNVFENNMDDRSVSTVNYPFDQSNIDNRTFKNDNDTDNCYEIIDRIVKGWTCCLFLAEGEWHVMRWPEAKDFGNLIPGTRYNYDLGTEAITHEAVKAIGLNDDIEPLNANHEKRLIRPVRDVKLTFNYNMPSNLIKNINFTDLGDFISTSTVGTTRTDLYEQMYWTYNNPPATDSYIVVKENTITGVELDRYAVLPFRNTGDTYLKSNNFEVNEGDRFECSVRFRGDSDTGDNAIFRFGFLLIGASNNWSLTNVSGSLVWNNIGSATTANSLTQTVLGSDDLTQWQSINVFAGTTNEYIPVIPEDGELQLQIKGFNDTNVSQPNKDTYIKDISFSYFYYINESTKITGHEHLSQQTEAIKNNYETTIYVDDVQKSSVKGVMFLNDGSKTSEWHRGTISESKQFGYIQKLDLMFLMDEIRTRIEGDYFGLKDSVSDVSLLSIFTYAGQTGKYFICGPITINLMAATWSGVLEEIWNESESFDETDFANTFKYIYRQ